MPAHMLVQHSPQSQLQAPLLHVHSYGVHPAGQPVLEGQSAQPAKSLHRPQHPRWLANATSVKVSAPATTAATVAEIFAVRPTNALRERRPGVSRYSSNRSRRVSLLTSSCRYAGDSSDRLRWRRGAFIGVFLLDEDLHVVR